ncbi:MAG: pyridoxamine 5'-phosphate oxidase [Myxococcota bacterium]|nr:pyridoxamine 5'-phosphate oxidase [Myxococcota bacterium]
MTDNFQPNLSKANAQADPFEQFERWFAVAEAEIPVHPEAMALATSTPSGTPAVRMVLCKQFDARGFVFYTSYESKKASHLEANPWAEAVFWWGAIDRQVRVLGQVRRVSAEDSDAYFATRPRNSQIGAWASTQSRAIASRSALEARVDAVAERWEGQSVQRPPHWGGYRIEPTAIEFWEGRSGRLHDRLRYTKNASDRWTIERLAP